MRLAFASLVLASAFLVLGLPASRACAAGALRLNELLPGPASDWDGSGAFSSRDDEWIEVINAGTDPCDLAGFFLTDGDSIPRYAFSGTLAPGDRRLVFGRDSYDWERATAHPAFGLSLGNSGDAAMLWQVAGAETVLVDSYVYGSHEAAADRAIGRVPEGTGAWTLFDSLDPYTGTTVPLGTGCAPTPGSANVCDGTPARSVTWGRVKTLYR
jgi:Lamin Tail Domain